MNIVEKLHQNVVSGRRVRRLVLQLAELLPSGSSILDVGCGDGLIDSLIARRRPDLTFRGIEVLARDQTHIPIDRFDGSKIPHGDTSFDVVMLIDVLHHTEDPTILIAEAARVARQYIVIKDHNLSGFLAGPTLRFMDRTGNARYGVSLPYNYWPRRRWVEAFDALRLQLEYWGGDLGLYPWPASLVFGRQLHFIAKLKIPGR